MNLRRPSHRSLIVGILTSISLGLTSDAVTVLWDGTMGLFNNPLNWAGDVVPAAGDDDRINNGGTAIIDSTQAINALFVILGDVTGTSGNLQMTGGSLTTTSDIRIGNGGTSGGTGVITHSGGDVVMNGGNMNVGFGDTAVGRYDVSGGTFLIGSANIFAVGNRGSGVVNQTGGSIYVRGSTANAAASQVNLGRNGAVAPPNPGTASGTYTLSGGDVTAATLRFGNNANGATTGSTNIFNLQGTGVARFGAISIINPNATNTFNFTGGSLTANTISIPLTNNGGVLRPATLSFAGQALADVQGSAVGTTTFDVSSYTQTALGTLAIDIASPTSNDFLNIGFGLSVADATLAGTIAVNLLNGFDPPLGSTFDIVSADTITETAAITGLTPSGLGFDAFEVNSPDGREILRLVVIPESSTFALLASTLSLAALRRRRLV